MLNYLKHIVPNYLKHIGLIHTNPPHIPQIYKFARKLELLKIYRTYLIDLRQNQDSRLNTIESKNSQLIGQSSIVISIVALFIPLFINNLNTLNVWVKIPMITLFIGLILHFILTILHASKTLEIDKSKYMTGSTKTITKADRSTTEGTFINNENKDLVRIINHNNKIINRTASNLVYASRCFKIAIIGFLFFSFFLLTTILVVRKQPETITISNINELKGNSCEPLREDLIYENQNLKKQLRSINDRLDSFIKSNTERIFSKTDTTVKKH